MAEVSVKSPSAFHASRTDWFKPDGREQNIKDYIALANQLIWKRQGSFFAAAVLAAIYFDALTIFAFYAVVVATELLDVLLGHQSKKWDGEDRVVGRRIFLRIAINTILSALAISAFILSIAHQETSPGHFTSLFFLFSASVFASMYNSQMLGILVLRLSIYGCAFLYIAFLDVVRYLPPLSSPIWLQFWTIIFVLYFIADMSLKFYLSYQKQQKHMSLIEEENEHTKAALEVKSRFLAIVSHELRTPLTSIVGSLEILKSEKFGVLPDPLKPVLTIAARNSERLTTLVEDLLDLQKLEAGEMRLHFKTINANDLVQEAVEAIAGYASKVGIEVTSSLCEEDCNISGDRQRLIQVMNNLLSNALKFSDDGGTVLVRVEELGGKVRISVQDEGIGIPVGAQDAVFGKFSQVDASDIRKVGGTGLGLNISKQIIERHGALIDYTSKLGVGSVFFIEFDRVIGGDVEFNAATQAA
ncbi:sensor histidine kinase [Sulfitobacter sp. 1A05707]|uniref:sensor histidine kinase n=1 Tax=Sulfitobacter sp. 1A05707 TaxID=3368560 RepID=UPI003746E6C0